MNNIRDHVFANHYSNNTVYDEALSPDATWIQWHDRVHKENNKAFMICHHEHKSVTELPSGDIPW